MPTSCHRLELENSPSARLAAVLVEEPRVGGALLVGGGINEANRGHMEVRWDPLDKGIFAGGKS